MTAVDPLKGTPSPADGAGAEPTSVVGSGPTPGAAVIHEYDQATADVVDDVPHSPLAELRELGAFGKVWTLTVVLFCIARAVVIWPALRKYGVNPYWFLVLDVGTAPLYGLGQAMGVKLLRDERHPMKDAIPWVAMVIFSFLAPYIYVLLSAGHLPIYVILGVVLWMLVFGGLSAYRMHHEVKHGCKPSLTRASNATT